MQTALILAATLNAAILAGVLAVRSWPGRAWGGLLAAAFLAIGALAFTLILAEHSGWIARSPGLYLTEGALTLAAGPVLLLFICTMLGRGVPSWALAVPALAYAASWLVWRGPNGLNFEAERLSLIQMGFGVAALVIVARYRPPGQRMWRIWRLTAIVTAAQLIIHAAQLVRLVFPGWTEVTNIVPATGAGLLIILSVLVFLTGSLGPLQHLTEEPAAPAPEAETLLARLDALLGEGGLADAGLTLQGASDGIGAESRALSAALAALRQQSFPEYLQAQRVEAAKRLLADPAEARTSMEAIGLLSGFGSRSAFYKAFRDHTGLSPAAWRNSRT